MQGFTSLDIVMDMEHPRTPVFNDRPIAARLTHIGLLRAGTDKGKASIAMRATLPDGTEVAIETTWALMQNAIRALQASPIGAPEKI